MLRRLLLSVVLLPCAASLPAQITAIPAMVQPSSWVDMDAVGPTGPTTLAALIAAGTNGGAFLLSGVTLVPNSAAVGLYNTNAVGNALGYDTANTQMVLVAPGGVFDAFDAQFDFLVPMTEFGIGIGDWVGAMVLEFRLMGSVVGTITTASYSSPNAQFFQSQLPFDQVLVRATASVGNWVISELYLQNGFGTLATNTAIGAGCGGLSVAANTRPVIGTSWDLSLNGIPSTGTIGAEIYGLTDPGISNLTGIGLPGCGLRAALDYLNAFLVGGSTHAYSLVLPNDPTIVGMHVFTTGAVFLNPPTNSFGAITGSAIDGMIGDV